MMARLAVALLVAAVLAFLLERAGASPIAQPEPTPAWSLARVWCSPRVAERDGRIVCYATPYPPVRGLIPGWLTTAEGALLATR